MSQVMLKFIWSVDVSRATFVTLLSHQFSTTITSVIEFIDEQTPSGILETF